VAGGLLALNRRGGPIPGGKWAAPLFIVGPELPMTRTTQRIREQREQLIQTDGSRHGISHHQASGGLRDEVRVGADLASVNAAELAREQVAAQRPQADTDDDVKVFGGGTGHGMVNFFPPLRKRLEKLRRLGASVEMPPQPRRRFLVLGGVNIWANLLVAFLMVLVVLLSAVAVVLLTALSLGFSAFIMLSVYVVYVLFAPQ
jgi:hypothetical protein